SRAASSLLSLDGAPVLLNAKDFLVGWRSGAMDLGALSDTVAALHELRNEAESQGQPMIARLCDALIEAYERLEDHELTVAAFNAFSRGHERLLDMFDAIAAQQKLPDVYGEINALAEAKPEPRRRDDPDLIDEDRSTRSAKVVDFPAFVRPAPPPAEGVG